jgi:uncharacterized protein (DUF1778 family)
MSTKQSTRIDLRVDAYRKSIILRAAEMSGVNTTQFIMDRIFPEAERIVLENHRTKLPKEDWEQFRNRLDEPPRDLPELRCLIQEASIFVKD